MKPRCWRFRMRDLLVAIALIALNLGAGITTAEHYPRPTYFWAVTAFGKGLQYNEDGSIKIDQGSSGYIDFAKIRSRGKIPSGGIVPISPSRPSLVEIWTPLLITLTLSGIIIIFYKITTC